ncbi:MAG: hypothetical protein Q8R36_05080 [bacterium]|nr:hypothetical protein [bacterium]
MIHEGTHLYTEIDKFVNNMNLLLRRLQPLHDTDKDKVDQDKKRLWDVFRGVLEVNYQYHRTLFQKKDPEQGIEVMSRERQLQHNYSVSQLRREFKKIQRKAKERFG